MTTIAQQYKNQIDRIRRALKQSSKRGFIFGQDVTLKDIIKPPKKVTAGTIRRLKKLNADTLRKQYAEGFVDFKRGQVYSVDYGRKHFREHNRDDRLAEAIAADAADVIINNFVNHIGQWVIYAKGGKGRKNYSYREYAMQWLSGMLTRYPKPVVARGLQKAYQAGAWLSTTEVYHIGVETAIQRIASYIDLPQSEQKMMQQQDSMDGEFYDLDEYTRDNVYYSDLYNF